jgi:aminoglycoside 6'-N-acetyltransferase I
MEIQPLSSANLNALINLVLALWPECNFDEEYDFYKTISNAPNEVCYLIKENNDFLAFIHANIRTDYVEGADESPVAYIEALYVKPEYQNTGIGKSLVKAIEKWSLQKGCKEIASDTQLNNINAINFHKKIGFDEVNRIVCFIKKIG